MLSELRPTEQYLNRLFIKNYATKWRDIGLELNITGNNLDIIKTDNPNEVQKRCRGILKVWLDIDPEASWEKLLHAVEATDKHHHSVSVSVETGESLLSVETYHSLLYVGKIMLLLFNSQINLNLEIFVSSCLAKLI